MYDVFANLLEKKGVKTSTVASATGISNMTLSDWKNGKSTPKVDKLQKIADYFEVTVDYLISGKTDVEKNEPSLSSKNELDISRKLDETLSQLTAQDGLMFDGEVIDEETRRFLRDSLENTIRTSKILAKQKFTPKKYRKDE